MVKRNQKSVSHVTKQRNPKNKKLKTSLIFDEKARTDYLTGFRKRKQERKKKAHEKVIADINEEKRQVKKKRREELNEKWKKLDLNSNLDSCTDIRVIDSPSHTVTVTDIANTDFIGSSGYHLGINQFQEYVDKPQKSAAESDEENKGSDDEDSGVDAKSSKNKKAGIKSTKHKKGKKFHKNLTHLMSKQKMAKKNKIAKREGSENRSKMKTRRHKKKT